MKPVFALTLAAVALPALLAAQSQSAPSGSSTNPMTATITTSSGNPSQTTVAAVQVASCPVSMQAKQGSGSGLVMVRKNHPDDSESALSSRPSQNIHLILGKLTGSQFAEPQQIVSGTVLVKGISARDHLDRTLSPADHPSDLRRTLNATFSTASDGTVSADLNLPGFTSVNSIKLQSIALSDGSNWSFTDLKTCVVTPDRIMLIGGQ